MKVTGSVSSTTWRNRHFEGPRDTSTPPGNANHQKIDEFVCFTVTAVTAVTHVSPTVTAVTPVTAKNRNRCNWWLFTLPGGVDVSRGPSKCRFLQVVDDTLPVTFIYSSKIMIHDILSPVVLPLCHRGDTCVTACYRDNPDQFLEE